jgi:hypothetical protein
MSRLTHEDHSIESFGQLFDEIRKYLKLQKEYTFIKLTSKLAILFSTLMLTIIFLIFGVIAVFYFLFALAYALQPHIGLPMSFVLIGGLNVLFIILLAIFRKPWIIKPTVNFLAHVFLDDEDKNGGESDEKESDGKE